MNSNGLNQNLGTIPPAAYGNPMYPLSYEQRVAYAHNLRQQQREFIESRLKENYPTKFAIVFSILMILHSIAQIVLHIILIVFNGALYYIYHGIWGGAILLILPVLVLLLIKFPKYPLYIATMILIMILNVLVTLGIIMISGFGFMEYDAPTSRFTSSSSSNANRDMIPVTAVMLALAIIAFILPFVFTIVMGRVLRKPRATVNYNNGTLYPNNVAVNPYYPQNLQQNSFNQTNSANIPSYPVPNNNLIVN